MFRFYRAALVIGLVAAASILSACDSVVEKSRNPTSPLIAGPIAGVGITAPGLSQPTSGSKFAVDQQPVTLVIQNSETNGERTVYYAFEVASDRSFATLLVSQDAVPAGTGGFTSFKLPSALAPERTYYWRSQARDGANSSEYSNITEFQIFTPVVLQAPALLSPINSERASSRTPELAWTNATRTGPAGAITYTLQLSTDEGFSNVVAFWTVGESATRTVTTVPTTLNYDTRYFWRARAVEASVTGPWSSSQTFFTPTAPVVVPPPPPPGGTDASDELDLRTVTILLGPSNFSSWPVTSQMTSTRQGNGELCTFHTMLGQWPHTDFFGDPSTQVEGNQWVFANIGGRWYGGAGDWYRPNQACKGNNAAEIGHDAFSMEPLHSWVPVPGELYGLAASTPARAWPAMATLDQRTNTVLRRWQ